MHTANLLVRSRLFAKAGLFRPTRERSEDFDLWLLRDVIVIRDVLGWARRSPHVGADNVALLTRKYRSKARWCLGRLVEARDGKGALRFATRLLAGDPRWAVDRGFVSGLARGILRAARPARAWTGAA